MWEVYILVSETRYNWGILISSIWFVLYVLFFYTYTWHLAETCRTGKQKVNEHMPGLRAITVSESLRKCIPLVFCDSISCASQRQCRGDGTATARCWHNAEMGWPQELCTSGTVPTHISPCRCCGLSGEMSLLTASDETWHMASKRH